MGFPATKSSVSQIIEKLDSLPNSARDTAVNNSIVPSDNLAGLGESVLKLYSESSPSAREAIAEMFELACNEPFDNWLDRVERICDGFSKQRECVRGLCQRLDVCSPQSRLQLGSGRGGAYRRWMPGRSLGRSNHRRLQIYL